MYAIRMFCYAICLMMSMSVSAQATMISGHGYDIDETVEISNETVEFVGIRDYIGFDFKEYPTYTLLTLFNIEEVKGFWWMNYGKYTFGGFEEITDMYVLENIKFYGTVVHRFSFDEHSISLNMNDSFFACSNTPNQSLTFYIETPSHTIPEPTSLLLFCTGLLVVARVRR